MELHLILNLLYILTKNHLMIGVTIFELDLHVEILIYLNIDTNEERPQTVNKFSGSEQTKP